MTKLAVESLVYFSQCRDGVVELPTGLGFRQARFRKRNSNLVIESAEYARVFVRDFFCHDILPTLRTESGDEMPGSLAAACITLSERTVSALMSCSD